LALSAPVVADEPSFTDLSHPEQKPIITKTEARDTWLAPGSVAVGNVVEVRAEPVLMGAVVMAVQRVPPRFLRKYTVSRYRGHREFP
jgi:hypothetical protein